MRFYANPADSTWWHVFNIYRALDRFCVPVLLMISGVFLLDAGREYPLKKLYFQKILRLLTAYLFWSALYAAYVGISGGAPLDAHFAVEMLKRTVTGHYHLWFLPMLIGLYIVSPILRLVCTSKRASEYFLALWFLFELMANFFSLSRGLAPFFSWLENALMPHVALRYSGYFILGHYLANYRFPRRMTRALYALGALSLAFSIGGTAFLSLRSGTVTARLHAYLLPNTAFYSAAVFVAIRNRLEHFHPSPRAARAISRLSALSFGAYLAHEFVLILLRHLGISPLDFFPVLSVPLLSCVVAAVSFSIAYLLSKIPRLNRYIL